MVYKHPKEESCKGQTGRKLSRYCYRINQSTRVKTKILNRVMDIRTAINLLETAPTVFFHVTPTKNLRKVKKNGLVPNIGDRSASIGEGTPMIYLFGSKDDAEDAVINWLGDEFDEDESLSLLAVTLPPGVEAIKQAFEYVVTEGIPSECLKNLGEI